MIVVADTSPVNYLLLIGEIDILPVLFGQVFLPSAVLQELQHPKTSAKVRQWIAAAPGWWQVRTVSSKEIPALSGLDAGNGKPLVWRWS
jgi:predicted nucleic acid-binding protein